MYRSTSWEMGPQVCVTCTMLSSNNPRTYELGFLAHFIGTLLDENNTYCISTIRLVCNGQVYIIYIINVNNIMREHWVTKDNHNRRVIFLSGSFIPMQ